MEPRARAAGRPRPLRAQLPERSTKPQYFPWRVVAVVLGGRSGASRDQRMASLIEDHLPRAYAGNRTVPPVVEGSAPAMVAEAPAKRPVDLTPELAPAPVQAPVKVASATPQATVTPSAPAPITLRYSWNAVPTEA